MKRLLVLVIVCCLLTGCGHSPVGKYVSDKNPSVTLELKGDGTFGMFVAGTGTTGTYTVDGNDVTLTMGPLAEKATLSGDKLTMASQTFTKQ